SANKPGLIVISGGEMGYGEVRALKKITASRPEPLCERGDDYQRRSPVINHSASGMFAISDCKWKLFPGNDSDGGKPPK
ncbi:MAG: hypothetical protein VB980_00270, partial [Opitutales bacterium]